MPSPQPPGAPDPLAATLDSADSLDDELLRRDLKAKLFGRPSEVLVGRYRIERRIGRGGMGVVYEAIDPELDRKVALKLLLPGRPAGRERMMREARAMARLSHPNVVTVHEVGSHGDQVFVAMEFVHGPTLRQWSDTPRSVPEILAVFRQAAVGLDAAHRAGLVHRDFKPENVLIGNDGWVKVVDFGLARAGTDVPELPPDDLSADRAALDERLTRTGHLLGTPAYMPPEQFLGQSVDAAGDVFSFCVALYEALAGRRPFEGKGALEIFERVRAGEYPALRVAAAPPAVSETIERGLHPDAAQRLSSLQPLIAVLSQPEPRKNRGPMWAGLASAGTVLLTLVSAGAGFFVYQAEAPVEVPVPAPPRPPDPPPIPTIDLEEIEDKVRHLDALADRARAATACRQYTPRNHHDANTRVNVALGSLADVELSAGDAGPRVVQASTSLLDAERASDACGLLGAYLATDGAPRATEARCLFHQFCGIVWADVSCPDGTTAMGSAGCVPQACEAASDKDDGAAAAQACREGQAQCCAQAARSVHEDADEKLDLYGLGCEGGDALACASAAGLLERAQIQNASEPVVYWTRACLLGNFQACRWVSPSEIQTSEEDERCMTRMIGDGCSFLQETTREDLQTWAAFGHLRWEVPGVLRGHDLESLAKKMDWSAGEVEAVGQAIERYRKSARGEVGRYHREIIGKPMPEAPGWSDEIHRVREHIKDDERWGAGFVAAVQQQVADERGGYVEPPGQMDVAQRYLRYELSLGTLLEKEIAASLGPEKARALHLQEDGWSGAKYGTTLRPPRDLLR